MIMTTFTCFTLALVVLAGGVHIVRMRSRFAPSSTLAVASGSTWIVTSFAIVGAMVDQATQHPESMPPDALWCGVVSAAIALGYGLVAVVPAMVASAVSGGTDSSTRD